MSKNKEKEHDILDNVKQDELFLKETSDPFEVNKMNQETLRAIEDIESGNLDGGFSSVKELIKDLNN